MRNIKFKEIAEFSYGKMPSKNLINDKEKYPIFSGYIYSGFYPYSNCQKDSLILIARGVGGTGDVKFTKQDCWLTNLSIKINIKSCNVLSRYLYYKFQANNLNFLNSGSAQPQITIGDLSELTIDIHDLSIQHSIVNTISLTSIFQ